MRWQRRARLLIGVFVVVFAVGLAFAFKKRTPPAPPPTVVATDPGAVVQSTGGRVDRFTFAREAVSVQYDKQLTYSDNTTRMLGVRVVTTERGGGRTFTITGREGRVGQNESTMTLDGDVQIVASDGLTLKTEHATYAEADGVVRAPGPVAFARGRMSGRGVGLTYDKGRDVLTILDQAAVRIDADARGEGAADITAGAATMARRDKTIRFERSLHVQRPKQTIDADGGTAYLSSDEKRVEGIDLQGNAKVGGIDAAPGGLQALTGQSMNLKYAADGEALQRAVVSGGASIQLAGEIGKPGREIVANTLDISLGPDGATPTALLGRQNVKLTMPAAADTPARSIASDAIDAKGEAGRGLTRARFTGSVDYREIGAGVNRAAKSAALDAALKPGLGEIDDARFSGHVRFEEGNLAASADAARYDLAKGALELRGRDRDQPHLVNERIAVDAVRMDVVLAGPQVHAVGSVKSVLQPPKSGADDASKVPSMLKKDQPVNVTADELAYDGAASKAVYTGAAVLWQGDTSVKGASITIDDKTGDLSAAGPVTSTAMLEQTGKDNRKERVRSIATAGDFKYTEAKRLAVYTGDAHLSGPQGDITAGRIDLYLEPSGDEVDRAESFATDETPVTIREQHRKTTGAHMTYTSADDRYVVTGKPATNVDACGNETTGGTLIFVKATDTIIVDGNGFRTQTTGTGGACK